VPALAPFPVPGSGEAIGGPHAHASPEGRPYDVAWASSGRCPLPVCGFPAVWVVCRSVHCGLCLVAGEGAGAGAGLRSMPSGLCRPALGARPRRRPPRRRASPAPFFLADRGGLLVVVGGMLPRINIGANVWGEASIMTGVYERWCSSTLHIGWGLCGCLCLVLVCRGRYGLGGVFLLFILGSNLGGVGPVRGLRGGG